MVGLPSREGEAADPSDGKLMATTASRASWKRDDDNDICLYGTWTLLLDQERQRELADELGQLDAPAELCWDLHGIDRLDSAGARLLWDIWGQQLPEHVEGHEQHRHWFDWLANAQFEHKPHHHYVAEALDRLGGGIIAFVAAIGEIFVLIGRLLLAVGYCIRHPRAIPWKETTATIHHVGATSMMLIGAVGFLIGVVMTIQLAMTLSKFGAGEMIISTMGLAMLRELGPVITGLILAGRSGSAMTSGIGAMHLTGEYDALRAFGSSPALRLALPRVLGAAISLPLLVVWADVAGLLGGALMAQADLNVGYRLFLSQLPQQVQIVNFWMGLAKGVLFGLTIGIVGCYFGMKATPDASALSRNTTLSVVTSLTLILVFDATSGALLTNVGLT
jgi:phospholipid/cholesterol/gamma-HCH transport system permease protein